MVQILLPFSFPLRVSHGLLGFQLQLVHNVLMNLLGLLGKMLDRLNVQPVHKVWLVKCPIYHRTWVLTGNIKELALNNL